MRKILFLVLFLAFSMCLLAEELNPVYVQYIEQYRDLAIEQQRKHKVPAAITMAQGLLESAAGQSELATKANNHFGIKCADWNGKKVYKDDDTKNECFRSYPEVSYSYEDHSLFLQRKRYQSLFALPLADYKSWAHGLKACGYATDPKYADKLIHLIELYNLQDLTLDPDLKAGGFVSDADTCTRWNKQLRISSDGRPRVIQRPSIRLSQWCALYNRSTRRDIRVASTLSKHARKNFAQIQRRIG